jgi:glycosyltransferase involved in cell wall biosynthesis
VTRREALRWRDDIPTTFAVRTLEVDHGESGASRNSAVAASLGRFVALCDGDDLVSRYFFSAAHELAASRAEATIVHPETVLSFGERAILWKVATTDDPELGYQDLLTANLWPSCSLSRRETYLEFPYPVLQPGSGFGPEDYAWNMTTATAGIPHIVAPESFFFYRTRARGGVNNAHSGSVLPPFDIRALEDGFPKAPAQVQVASVSQTPELAGIEKLIARVRPVARKAARLIPSPLRPRVRARVAHIYGALIVSRRVVPATEPGLLRTLREAAEIEPALSWVANGFAHIEKWVPPEDQFAAVFEGLASALAGTEVIILAPWVGIGGADLVTLNYATALANAPGLEQKVSVLTTYLPERTIRGLIPDEVRHYQVDTIFRNWPLERQQKLIAQLMVFLKPKLILSINCFDFTNSLREYARPICAGSEVYLSLFAFDRIGEGSYPVNPITDDPQRSFLNEITGIITDNTVTAATVSEILGVDREFVRVHHQSAAIPVYDFGEVVKQTAAFYDREFSPDFPFRVVWPHRLDKEKRPDTLLRIAERIQAERLPIEIHVYGQRILNNGNDDLIPQLTSFGVQYMGPYSGGLIALPTEEFHALLLTSESEGMPLVLAQALLLGLPVVASAVGGVVDLISDHETGLLTDGPDDIDGFVNSLTALMNSVELRRELIRKGYESAAAQHGIDAFAERALTEFGFETRSRREA